MVVLCFVAVVMMAQVNDRLYHRSMLRCFSSHLRLVSCLFRVTFRCVTQHASKFGKFEIGCAKRTLEMSCNVLPILLQDGNTEFLDTVTMLFDSNKTIFSPLKTMWTTAAGSPEASVTCPRRRHNFCIRELGTLDSLERVVYGHVGGVQSSKSSPVFNRSFQGHG